MVSGLERLTSGFPASMGRSGVDDLAASLGRTDPDKTLWDLAIPCGRALGHDAPWDSYRHLGQVLFSAD